MALSLAESLVEQSTLTPRQLDVLRGYLRVASGEMKYREAALTTSEGRRKGKPGPVTVGSYFRTVQQARENIRKSVATLLVGVWEGLIKPEDVRRLLDVAGSGAQELTDDDRERLVVVLRALLQRIVM